MRVFTEALREVKTSILKIYLFEEVLNAILIFLLAYLISSLFKLGLMPPLAAGLAYLAFAVYRESRLRASRMVESRYRDLKEKLSTAAEYANVDNRVVNELKTDVLRGLSKVEESSFLNERRVYAKSIVAIALCFIILLLSPVSVGFFRHAFPDLFQQSDSGQGDALQAKLKAGKGNSDTRVPIGNDKSSQDIFGVPSVAKLGSEEIRVTLKPAVFHLSTANVKPPEELQFTDYYPEEVFSVAAESVEERSPREQQELIRRYFRNVVETGR